MNSVGCFGHQPRRVSGEARGLSRVSVVELGFGRSDRAGRPASRLLWVLSSTAIVKTGLLLPFMGGVGMIGQFSFDEADVAKLMVPGHQSCSPSPLS